MQSIVTLTITDAQTSVALVVSDEHATVQLAVTETPSSVTLTLTDSKGATGLSAYEVWLALGNSGDEVDFLAATAARVSPQPNNRLTLLHDGLHVLDDLAPDPLAFYILAKG